MSDRPPPSWLLPTRRVDLATREGRIEALGKAATALLHGEMLDDETRVFLGAALLGWLGGAGDLERDLLKVSGPAGSHRTPAMVWRASSRGRQDVQEADTVDAPDDEKE